MHEQPLVKRGPGGDYTEELWEGEVEPWQWSAVGEGVTWVAALIVVAGGIGLWSAGRVAAGVCLIAAGVLSGAALIGRRMTRM